MKTTDFPIGSKIEFVSKTRRKIRPGTIATVINHLNNDELEIAFGNNTMVISCSKDFFRIINYAVIVRRPGEPFAMSEWELSQWANMVYVRAGGKAVFEASDFPERLKGHHCSCGVNKLGYTNGEFRLHPVSSLEKDIGKAYMTCCKCGCVSHL